MEIDIDIDKMKEIYGDEIIKQIKLFHDEIRKSLIYMCELKFDDIANIFERYPTIFICSFDEFKVKIDRLIEKLGKNYVELIENDLGLLEELE